MTETESIPDDKLDHNNLPKQYNVGLSAAHLREGEIASNLRINYLMT